MNEIISIIAPAYNHEKYIANCIKSIANQTYKEKELIIIDDVSKDNTPNIIEELIKDKSIIESFPGGIKFIKHKKNTGAYESINEGIGNASGKYITIINTDDLFEKNRLEELIKCLNENYTEIVFSKVETIDERDAKLLNDESDYYEFLQKKIDMYPFINFALLTDNVAISTGNMLFTKNLFEKVGTFKEYQYIHDWDFILRASLICEPAYTEKTSYLYRLHDTNSFKELQKDTELCGRESLKVLLNFCKKIQNKRYINPKIQDVDVWEYFIFSVTKNPDIAHIWNLAKETDVKIY